MPGLTVRQRAFIREYLTDQNAAEAAVRAGYSARTAARTGVSLLENRQVAAALERLAGRRPQLAGREARGSPATALCGEIGPKTASGDLVVGDPAAEIPVPNTLPACTEDRPLVFPVLEAAPKAVGGSCAGKMDSPAEAENMSGETTRTPRDILADIQAVTREAWEEGDLKTALRGLEVEARQLESLMDREGASGARSWTDCLALDDSLSCTTPDPGAVSACET